MEAVHVANGKISLTQAAINWVGDDSASGLFVEGDALIPKKVRTSRLSEIAGRVSKKEPQRQEIVAEVNSYRRERSEWTVAV